MVGILREREERGELRERIVRSRKRPGYKEVEGERGRLY